MKLGIVGSEAAKFTPETEADAKHLIRGLIIQLEPETVVSGGCHLGGIDLWAEEIASELLVPVIVHKPAKLNWSQGYAPRNRLIVRDSDEVHCITVANLPPSFAGMRFPMCYHCGTNAHVKSGGCWTMKKARDAGKKGVLHVI